MRRLVTAAAIVATMTGLLTAITTGSNAQQRPSAATTAFYRGIPVSHWCNTNGTTCTEPFQKWEDFPWFHKVQSEGVRIQEYIGHDEPSVLFYSNTRGSGNDNTYHLVLPRDPPVAPAQDQSGATWNFQLHPAFWFGMAMCDDQSAPNPPWSGAAYPNRRCAPDSDSNIYTSTNASSGHYIGKHPGVAFMEMQFYPPGWVKWPVGNSCDATRWCAALNIDSLSEDMNTGTPNNSSCLNSAGIEPVNFAFLTTNGVATAPANPLDYSNSFVLHPSKDFFMKSGDILKLHMFDTSHGFTVRVDDITAGTTGGMVASAGNGFGSVRFDPNANSCKVNIHAFHPEYSTSSPDTRVTWAAHSYNVAYSDEIGHFEYCRSPQSDDLLSCATTQDSGFATNNVDLQDMNYCLPIPGYPPSRSSLVTVKGCLGVLGDNDVDFDGVSYDARAWPGSMSNQILDRLLAPEPIKFTSPKTTGGAAFDQAAFETDLSRIEDNRGDLFGGVLQYCQRIKDGTAPPPDPNPGAGCFNPPPQSRFYPFFSTTQFKTQCLWEEGGAHLPNTTNTFGGEKAEYGRLLDLFYPESPPGAISGRLQDFRRILSDNPCP